jgi:putative membrane protein
VIAAVLLAALNTVLKPILFVLTFPFILLTLGLFLLVINAIVLWVTAMIVPGFRLDGFATTFIASLVLAAVSMAWKAIATDKS